MMARTSYDSIRRWLSSPCTSPTR